MNKTRNSIYNAITSLLLTMLNGLTSIVIIQKIIEVYGSDFNGLNSTVNQLINMLLVVEGGFTLAISVSLFKPLTENNKTQVNSILSASRNIFKKIGLLFLIIGTIASVVITLLIKSSLPYSIIFFSFFSMIFSTFINLYYATKYRIVLQTDMKEYIINLIQIVLMIFSQAAILVILYLEMDMILIRSVLMLSSLISSVLIFIITKKKYSYINYSEKPNYKEIKGTKDVFVQKITSVLYGAFPMVFISMTVGTTFASVYIVYNNIFSLVKNIIYSLVNAPRIGFGRIIQERDKKSVFKLFKLYEFIIIFILIFSINCLVLLIEPFIGLYTARIADPIYKNFVLVILMTLILFFEIIHIPSGNIINMAGKFKVGKIIQTIASVILIISMIVMNLLYGFFGILVAVLVTAVILAILEITYIYIYYFEESLFKFIFPLLKICTFSYVMVNLQKMLIDLSVENYFNLFILAIFIGILNLILLIIYCFIFENKIFRNLWSYFKVFTNK